MAYWTHGRAAAAIPRDFAVDPATGRVVPRAKPVKPTPSALEPAWLGEGQDTVGATTGKVLFTLGSSNYVCSASVVDENTSNSVVVTAAHCAYDWNDGEAKNWMFIPGFDTGDSFSGCATTDYGCWTASSLWVNDAFKAARSFNTTAMVNDFAFAVMGPSSSLSETSEVPVLDAAVGSQPISFDGSLTTLGATTTSLGYPQASPYDGKVLRYCEGALGKDEYSKLTYRLPCLMTGGSSGGPWYSPLDTNGQGTQMSVNSYGYTADIRTTRTYNDTTMMFGPVFNSATKALYNAAVTAAA